MNCWSEKGHLTQLDRKRENKDLYEMVTGKNKHVRRESVVLIDLLGMPNIPSFCLVDPLKTLRFQAVYGFGQQLFSTHSIL